LKGDVKTDVIFKYSGDLVCQRAANVCIFVPKNPVVSISIAIPIAISIMQSSGMMPRGLPRGGFMCAWHGAQSELLAVAGSYKTSAVTGRKGNANKARAVSRNGASGGSMRQNPCT